MGNGRRGRGVYAVPLLLMARNIIDPRRFKQDIGTPVTSGVLWKWLVREGLPNVRARPAAIVFTLASSHWPIDLYLTVGGRRLTEFLSDLKRLNEDQVEISSDDLARLQEACERGHWYTPRLTIHAADALGLVLHHYQRVCNINYRYEDGVEAVIRKPGDRSQIERIVPLYRPNEEFKRVKKDERAE